MAKRFLITEHALDRFAERHAEADDLELDESRQVLLAELERAVPFGGQLGTEEFYLMPCEYVAAVAWRDGIGIVKTVLTKEQAIVNMQSRGAVLRDPSALTSSPAKRRPAESEAEIAELRSELRVLAGKHVTEGVGKKMRNAILRELGYDPAGKAGIIYRDAYRSLLGAKYAANREQYQREELLPGGDDDG